MCHTSEIMTGATAVSVSTRSFEQIVLYRFFRNRVRVLEHFRPRRLNADRVGNRQLIEQGRDRFQ